MKKWLRSGRDGQKDKMRSFFLGFNSNATEALYNHDFRYTFITVLFFVQQWVKMFPQKSKAVDRSGRNGAILPLKVQFEKKS